MTKDTNGLRRSISALSLSGANWVLPRLAAGTNQTTGLLPHDYLKLVKEQLQPAMR